MVTVVNSSRAQGKWCGSTGLRPPGHCRELMMEGVKMAMKFHRLEPTDGADGAAITNDPVLRTPRNLVAKLRVNDGIVVASWDDSRSQGRVHALGLVRSVDKSMMLVIVDWRRANFTVNPSPQGRTQWTSRSDFEFADGPAARYGLQDHFSGRFSDQQLTTDAPAPASASMTSDEPTPPPATQLATITSEVQKPISSSPQCNRVTPSGEIIATSARGLFMGNRADRSRWLVCELHFERQLKEPRKYTKLFFLDEAVALSAGHRPCQTCRRTRYHSYLQAVQTEFEVSGVPDLDRQLSAARNSPRPRAALDSLPDGTFVALGDEDFRIVWRGALHRWTPAGYVDPVAAGELGIGEATILTPAPSLAALRNRYDIVVHPSIAQKS